AGSGAPRSSAPVVGCRTTGEPGAATAGDADGRRPARRPAAGPATGPTTAIAVLAAVEGRATAASPAGWRGPAGCRPGRGAGARASPPRCRSLVERLRQHLINGQAFDVQFRR